MKESSQPRLLTTRRLVLAGSLLAALGAAVWLWRIFPIPWEMKSHPAEPGTLAFRWFVANGFIENVPLVPPTKGVRYNYTEDDVGFRVGLTYTTSAPDAQVKEALAAFMREQGFYTDYSHDKNEAWAKSWKRDVDQLQVHFNVDKQSDGATAVFVSHYPARRKK